MKIPRLIIAAPGSGAGKTTVSLGLMTALTGRGIKVQPYKVGPDFIDPTLHRQACGVASRNLDTWLLPARLIPQIFVQSARNADIALIEGVMGFYDGFGGSSDEASTAQMARLLECPVVLVIDAQGMARSAAAVVLGFKQFAPAIKISGIILNKVAGERHAEMCREAIEKNTNIPVLGSIPFEQSIKLPERHLGLIPTPEKNLTEEFLSELGRMISEHVDLPRIIEAAAKSSELPEATPTESARKQDTMRLSVAFDEAFNFYYQDALDFLHGHGAEITFFSPIHDNELPDGTSGIYLGGGFPEMCAANLESNEDMRKAIRAAAESGMPIFAECGGLMYLSRSLTTFEHRKHNMVGVLAGETEMTGRLTLNYTGAQATGNHPFLKRGSEIHGHEFHYSRIINLPRDVRFAYELSPGNGIQNTRDGLVEYSVLGSYMHTHLMGYPSFAKGYLEACRRYSKKS